MILIAPQAIGTVFIRSNSYDIKDHILNIPDKDGKGLVLRGTGYLPQHGNQSAATARRMLIIRNSGMGDVLMMSPIFRQIKAINPQCEITFLTCGEYVDLYRHNPWVDKVVNDTTWDTSIYYDFISCLNMIEFNDKKSFVDLHKIDLFADYLRIPRPVDKSLFLQIDKDEMAWAREVIGLVDKPIISFVFRSSCTSKHRDYKFLRGVANELSKEAVVILLDKAAGYGYEAPGIINACGKFSAREISALVACSSCVVCPDTGVLHLAAALDKRVVLIQGAINPNNVITHKNIKIIYKQTECFPCNLFECYSGHRCIGFTQDELIKIIKEDLMVNAWGKAQELERYYWNTLKQKGGFYDDGVNFFCKNLKEFGWLGCLDWGTGCKVLDAGCGPSGLFNYVNEDVFLTRVGVDSLIDKYKSDGLLNEVEGAIYINSKLEDLPKAIENGTYDFAFCINVLDHVENPTTVLNNLIDSLKVGGTFTLQTDLRDATQVNVLHSAVVTLGLILEILNARKDIAFEYRLLEVGRSPLPCLFLRAERTK